MSWFFFLVFLPVFIAGVLWEYTVKQFRAGRAFMRMMDG